MSGDSSWNANGLLAAWEALAEAANVAIAVVQASHGYDRQLMQVLRQAGALGEVILDLVSASRRDPLLADLPGILSCHVDRAEELVRILRNVTQTIVTEEIPDPVLIEGELSEVLVTALNAGIGDLILDLVNNGIPSNVIQSFAQIRRETQGLLDIDLLEKIVVNAKDLSRQLDVAVGAASADELSKSYDEWAMRLQKRNGWWVGTLIVSLLAAAFLGAFELRNVRGLSLETELSRLALSLPLLALAGFAAREAAEARVELTRARITSVQLRTVGAFAETAGPDGTQLRVLLGNHVFSAPRQAGPVADLNLLPIPQLPELLDKAANVLRAQNGNSKG